MKIRSITVFDQLRLPLDQQQITTLGRTVNLAAETFTAAGYEVQTVRLATNLLSSLSEKDDPVRTVVELEAQCNAAGFEFIALGPAGDNLPLVPEILQATGSVFATCRIVSPATKRINGQKIHQAARVIKSAAKIADGFGNLRFAALANVGPGIPFFPAAYWEEPAPAFAIATQSADLAVEATTTSADAAEAHSRLQHLVETHGQRLQSVARIFAKQHQVPFLGTDFSLAPFPGDECSIGAALEALTGRPLGEPGSLAAAAILTDAVQQADFHKAGFCGLMMPVLEDSVLARRAAEGRLRIAELLQWSAVCGTGLDTVPIPGDAGEEAVEGILFDVAALSIRANKPLTARLMPLPGKVAGDPVHFDFAYFADGGVLALGEGGDGPLAATPALGLSAYHRR